MSSSMRRRNGLMGFSLIGGLCLEVEVLNSSILKTERCPGSGFVPRPSTGLSTWLCHSSCDPTGWSDLLDDVKRVQCCRYHPGAASLGRPVWGR